ncbi:MAG: DegT/DnrJ/EryC1/StrS family aminotransferase [Candidatus Omnitrophota bacterium]
MRTRIYYAKPSITELEVRYATDAAANGWGDKCYEYIYKFETMFKQHLGVKYAIATSSCTGALHLGLAAVGIGPGDEVIMADTNWIQTAAPIIYLGGKPVFVDILPDTWCIDPAKVEAAITPRTKAIIAVHLYGNLCDMDALSAIGKAHDIPVIEDSAQAIGSVYKGRRAGSIGHFGVFSFHGTKTVTTGEGGMFVTNDDALYEKVLTLSNQGRLRTETKQFWSNMVGLKYKMANVQAAIGCAQMERVEELIKRKREIFLSYFNLLKELDCIQMNPVYKAPETQPGYWMPTVVFDRRINIDRYKLLEAFKENNIDGRIFFYPLSMMPMFEAKKENRVSYDIYNRAINLPTYYDITHEEQERVSNTIQVFIK